MAKEIKNIEYGIFIGYLILRYPIAKKKGKNVQIKVLLQKKVKIQS